ncbi:MAG: hypothetical protein RBS80_27005 [Thermoguttaceae bacterium]|jgi:YHS domain-containing protein|nr:hypothetical protein [Thermoguttaceae bacterium]
MNSRVLIFGLVVIVLGATVFVGTGWAGTAPNTQPCGHQGHCLCVPNVRNYGYYPTQWRQWPTEVRRDMHFPKSLGRERIPTPPGDPTEPLPIERLRSRPIPGTGDLPIPDGILPPEGPFRPDLPLFPEPAIPGGIPPFVPSTTPGSPPGAGIPDLPSDSGNATPLEEPAEPAEPAMPAEPEASVLPQSSLDRREESPSQSTSNGRAALDAAEPARGAPLRQPDSWTRQPQPRFNAIPHQASIGHEEAVQPATHESDPELASQSERLVAATFTDGQTIADPPLMLDGFCPVTLSNLGQWRPGRREHMAVYLDRTFHMAGPEERRQFLADPSRFAPMFGGIDPVVVVDEQRWTPGSIQYSAVYKGRIYMFSSKANLERFQGDPHRYTFELDE